MVEEFGGGITHVGLITELEMGCEDGKADFRGEFREDGGGGV